MGSRIKTNCSGFPPVSGPDAEILILGSIPSIASMEKREYYGHQRNAFWWIMGEILGFDCGVMNYSLRKLQLLRNGIALWDVLNRCERPGSLDSAIISETIIPNDFTSFFAEHANIKHIYFNGTKAEQEYGRRVKPELPAKFAEISCRRLPSTSPAMASLSKSAKLAQWRQIISR